jgi:hypothetical protein
MAAECQLTVQVNLSGRKGRPSVETLVWYYEICGQSRSERRAASSVRQRRRC